MQQMSNTNQMPNTNQFSLSPQFSPQPFSQYSTHQSQPSQYQNTFQYPIQPLPYTTQEDDPDKVEVTPADNRGRVQVFTQPEDILLAKAYVRISENPMFGTDQKFSMFWDKITSEYNETADEEAMGERGKKSLTNRFARMKSEMVTYNEAINFVDSHHHTGINETGRLNLVHDKFKQLNTRYKNRPFGFAHVVDILNKSSKFYYTTTRNTIPRFEDNDEHENSSSSHGEHQASGHASTEMQHHIGDKRSRTSSQDVSSPSRPMGSKAAKRAEKVRKGKAKEKSIDEEDERCVYMETLATHRKESLNYKIQALQQRNKVVQENFELQERKLALKEKKIAIETQKMAFEAQKLEMEKDLQIMSMDSSTVPNEDARERLNALKMNVMEKWARQGGGGV